MELLVIVYTGSKTWMRFILFFSFFFSFFICPSFLVVCTSSFTHFCFTFVGDIFLHNCKS